MAATEAREAYSDGRNPEKMGLSSLKLSPENWWKRKANVLMWRPVRGGTRAAGSGFVSLGPAQPYEAREAFRHNGESITQIAVKVTLYSIQDLNGLPDVSGTS